MVSNTASVIPSQNTDSTISAIVRSTQVLPQVGTLLRLWLPVAYHAGAGFGRFLLARCTEDTLEARSSEWSIYTRRPLFCAGSPTALPDNAGSAWDFLLPISDDPGYRWLANRAVDSSINLLGPFGLRFELTAHARTLLILTDIPSLPLTLPVIHAMLDRGGRVTVLIMGEAVQGASLLPLIPIPVEMRFVPPDTWLAQLAEPVRWADQICAALPNAEYAALAHHLRGLRFQFDPAFAQVLVTSDMLCGTGACLACVVSTRDGSYTRACVHGPVFPLATITA